MYLATCSRKVQARTANGEKIAELLRFASTHDDDAIQNVSLKDYVERMQEGQDAIYYVVADNHANNSCYIEVFRKKASKSCCFPIVSTTG